MLEFLSEYKDSGIEMELILWQFMRVYPKSKSYALDAVNCPDGNYKPTEPICKCIRGLIGVTSSGDIVPCLQVSGYFEENGIHMGNLHKTPLAELLTEGDYISTVCANLHKRRKNNPKCDSCRFFRYCSGGCPALGGLYAPEKLNLFGSDITKCLFYENGWYHKVKQTMSGWTNTTRINEFEDE